MNKKEDKTIDKIISSALKSFHRGGYTATSLNDILKKTKLSKGALYHHFSNKKELGFAVVEKLKEGTENIWVEPLRNSTDPVAVINDILLTADSKFECEGRMLGCPLNNLAQEMSLADEDFRECLAKVYTIWANAIVEAFEKAAKAGIMKKEINPRAAASFIIAVLSGGQGLAKVMNNSNEMNNCSKVLSQFLSTLKK